MSQSDSPADDEEQKPTIMVKRDQSVYQKETVTVRSKRGTGTRDQDTVEKEIKREAEIDLGESEGDLPSLIDDEALDATVEDVASVMETVRDSQPDA